MRIIRLIRNNKFILYPYGSFIVYQDLWFKKGSELGLMVSENKEHPLLVQYINTGITVFTFGTLYGMLGIFAGITAPLTLPIGFTVKKIIN